MSASFSSKSLAKRIAALESDEQSYLRFKRVYMAGQPDPNVPPEYAIGPDKNAYPMADLMNDEDAHVIIIKAAVPG